MGLLRINYIFTVPKFARNLALFSACAVPFIFGSLAQCEQFTGATYRVEKGINGDHLIGTFDSQDYWITNEDDEFAQYSLTDMYSLSIDVQADFDGDGYQDVLLNASNGGAASTPQFYIASHMGGSYFTISSAEGLFTYGDYELLPQPDGSTHIKVYYSNDGVGFHDRVDGFGVYSLQYGKLKRIADITNHARIPTFFDITSEELAEVGEATYEVDLDGDGRLDKIECRYWERWGNVICDFDLSKLGRIEISLGVDHIGVAQTSTSGTSDLVYNWTKIFKFNGNKLSEVKK